MCRWLWKNVLTGPQVAEAIETLSVLSPSLSFGVTADALSGNYFLLRKADFSLSLIRELHRLAHTKLLTSNPRSSTSVIRDSDLNNALLRASLGTSAETDSNLDKLSFKLEHGPLRPIMPSLQARKRPVVESQAQAVPQGGSPTRDLFSSVVLGAPVELRYRIGWPLDLFMTPSSIAAYSDIHAYLFALRDTHTRLVDAWARLSWAHRQRCKRGERIDEAGRVLSKAVWSTARTMLFFLDQLLGHFMIDIIDVQHQRLLNDLDVVGLAEAGDLAKSRSDAGTSPAASTRRGQSVRPRSSIPRFDPVSKSLAASARSEAGSPTSDGYDAQSVRSKARPPTPRQTQATFLDYLSLRSVITGSLESELPSLTTTGKCILAIWRSCAMASFLPTRTSRCLSEISSIPASASPVL